MKRILKYVIIINFLTVNNLKQSPQCNGPQTKYYMKVRCSHESSKKREQNSKGKTHTRKLRRNTK